MSLINSSILSEAAKWIAGADWSPGPRPPEESAAGGILLVRKDRRWTGTRRIPQDSRWKGQRIHRLPEYPLAASAKGWRVYTVALLLLLAASAPLFSGPLRRLITFFPLFLPSSTTFSSLFFVFFSPFWKGVNPTESAGETRGSCRLRKTTNFRATGQACLHTTAHARASKGGENVPSFDVSCGVYDGGGGPFEDPRWLPLKKPSTWYSSSLGCAF